MDSVNRSDFLRTLQQVAKRMTKKTLTKFSINDLRYWDARVYHPVYGTTGNVKESAAYAVRIQEHGERRNVALR